MPIKKRHLRMISRRFWGFFFGVIIACAVLVQIGRQAFPLMNDYRHIIAESLSHQMGVQVEIGNIRAAWKGLRPKVILNQVRVLSDTDIVVFNVDTALAELSLIDSFIQRGFAWRTITFRGFETSFVQNDNYSWSLKGYSGGTANADNPFLFDDPLDIFLFGRRVEIDDASINFELNNGKVTELTIPSISLENDRFFHRMKASLVADELETLTFVLEGYGDPRDKDTFSASGYFRLKDIPSIDIFNALSKHNAEKQTDVVSQGDQKTNLELWFKGSPSAGMTASGRLSLAGIPPQLETQFDLPERLTADISGAWKADSGWFLNLQDIAVDWGEKVLPLEALSFYGQGRDVGLRIAELNVTTLINVAIAANKSDSTVAANAVNQIKPQGVLKNVDVRLTSKDQGYFLAKAFVSQASSQAFKGSPALANISGYVEASLNGGYVDASIEQGFSLGLEKVFDVPIVINDVEGQLAWHLDLKKKTAYLKSSRVSATKNQSSVRGAFAMVLPFKREIGEQRMTMEIEVDQVAASQYRDYLPKHVPESLTEWLHGAVGEGELTDVSIFYHGSVSRSPLRKPIYQISGRFNDATLKYHKDWPTLTQASGTTFIDSDAFEVDLNHGRVKGALINSARVKLGARRAGKLPDIEIQADVSGGVASAQAFLSASPLPVSLLQFLNEWSFKGQFDSQVSITVPVDFSETDIDYRVETRFRDAYGHSPAIRLDLDAINGTLVYSKEGLAQAEGLRATLWDRPLIIDVISDDETGEVALGFRGDVNIDALRAWSQRPELFALERDFGMRGAITIPTSDKGKYKHATLDVSTDLDGVALDLPFPLAKTSEEIGTYRFFAEFVPDAIDLWYEHNGVMRAEAFVPEKGLPSIAVHLGSRNDEKIGFPGELMMSGTLARADFDAWLHAAKRYTAELDRLASEAQDATVILPEEAAVEAVIQVTANMAIENFHFGKLRFPDLALNVQGDDQHWQFHLDSAQLKGSVDLPLSDDPVTLALRYLSIDEQASTPEDGSEQNLAEQLSGDQIALKHVDAYAMADAPGQSSAASSEVDTAATQDLPEGLEAVESVFSELDFGDLIAMDVAIDELVLAGEAWGQWRFELRPIENGIRLKNLQAAVKELRVGFKAPSDLYWTRSDGQNLSYFKGQVETKNVGDALIAWGQERLINSKKANFDISAQWLAEPDLVSLANLNGDIRFDLSEGSFIRGAEAGENPLLRLIALFNFDTLARRLRLDFSDLAAKGFAYDRVTSQVNFRNGLATITEPLIVESSSSKMQVVGRIGLVEEDIDAQLVVTLPVANNLVVATAFLAGVPAGVGVYLVSKALGKTIDKASSVSYSVEGSWEDPKIKVRKIFDDSTETFATEGFELNIASAGMNEETAVDDASSSGANASDDVPVDDDASTTDDSTSLQGNGIKKELEPQRFEQKDAHTETIESDSSSASSDSTLNGGVHEVEH